MEIPFIFLLLLYLLLLMVVFIFVGLNIYHVVRFGFFDPVAKAMTFAFLFCILVILGATALFLIGTDWSQTIDFSLTLS